MATSLPLDYDSLEAYAELVNQSAELIAGIRDAMAGAFPDNALEPRYDEAYELAELLFEEANSLATAIKSARALAEKRASTI